MRLVITLICLIVYCLLMYLFYYPSIKIFQPSASSSKKSSDLEVYYGIAIFFVTGASAVVFWSILLYNGDYEGHEGVIVLFSIITYVLSYFVIRTKKKNIDTEAENVYLSMLDIFQTDDKDSKDKVIIKFEHLIIKYIIECNDDRLNNLHKMNNRDQIFFFGVEKALTELGMSYNS